MNFSAESKNFLESWFPGNKSLELASLALAQKFEEAELSGKEKILDDENEKIILDAKKAIVSRIEAGYSCSVELNYINELIKMNSKKVAKESVKPIATISDTKLFIVIYLLLSIAAYAFLTLTGCTEIARFFVVFSIISFCKILTIPNK